MNVTQSLFGMTPQSIQAQRDAEMEKQAMQFARLSPMESARMGLFYGVNQLGNAIGQRLGAEDPEMAQARARQGLLGGLDMSNPQALREAARMADPQTAQVLVNQALNVEKQLADVGAAQALAAQRSREANPVLELIKAGKYTPESVAKYELSGKVADLQLTESGPKFSNDAEEVSRELYGKAFSELTQQEAAAVNTLRNQRTVQQRGATAPKIINVVGTAENEYAKVAGKTTAERDIQTIDNAQQVANTLPKMYETRALLETGNLNTGIAAELQTVVDRARSKFLADKRAGKRVEDTEYLNALLGSDVFPQISALGIGARGLDTPAEREFLREVITGTISMDRETLKRMADFRIKAAERAVGQYNEKLEKGEFNQYQKVTGRQLQPIRSSTPQASPTANTGSWSIRPAN